MSLGCLTYPLFACQRFPTLLGIYPQADFLQGFVRSNLIVTVSISRFVCAPLCSVKRFCDLVNEDRKLIELIDPSPRPVSHRVQELAKGGPLLQG
jgi:hypothetical protein